MNEQIESSSETDQDMPFLAHLEVLRWHLIRSIICIAAFGIILFFCKSFVFDKFLFGPTYNSFITYQGLCSFSNWIHQMLPDLVNPEAMCLDLSAFNLQNLDFTGQFLMHILISIILGFIISFPYVFYEFWSFVSPALTSNERKSSRWVIFSSSSLFLAGASFGYFIIFPLAYNFFINYQVSEKVENVFQLNSYISTFVTILLGCGLVFELPVVVYFLTKAGLITPQLMRTYRRHALVGALILSAIITPPDVFSQLLVCIPVFILYEVSISISNIIWKNSAK